MIRVFTEMMTEYVVLHKNTPNPINGALAITGARLKRKRIMEVTNQMIFDVLQEVLKEIEQIRQEVSELRIKKKVAKKESEQMQNICYFPNSTELEACFQKFVEYRKHDKHNAMTERSIKMTVNTLNKFTAEESILALEEAMRNGYTGVFPKRMKRSVVDEWGNA